MAISMLKIRRPLGEVSIEFELRAKNGQYSEEFGVAVGVHQGNPNMTQTMCVYPANTQMF